MFNYRSVHLLPTFLKLVLPVFCKMELIYGIACLFVSLVLFPVSSFSDDPDTQKLLAILAEQRHDILQLKETVLRVENDNKELNKEIHSLKGKIEHHTSHNASTANMSPRHKRLLLDPLNEYTENQRVAFTPNYQKHMTNLGNNQPIVFDAIVTNVGQHYSPNTGVFTAPTNATFYFFASIMSHSGKALESEIVKKGVRW
ncbi:uncharacterized protein LOC128546931 [Mercenaria mercenaria]|uniref:uncharacterized protein LOC128546931 n=1 Tax=Mercenaria mercenaria TaxID=6596 RepID=UPI00234EE5EE|nr:uncharacterized protein LOC128546931 [Mercenaria mercenaria]